MFRSCLSVVVTVLIVAAGARRAEAVTPDQLSQLLMRATKPVTNGYRPAGGTNGHAGIDFGSTGDGVTSVYAPLSGTLTANTSACGKVAIFDGTNTFIFGHMTARTTLSVGQFIPAGSYVGKASMVTGGGCTATAAHLHVEIRTGNNTSMALPTANNIKTTLDPLAYSYDLTPPSVSIKSPSSGAVFLRGSTYTITWSANDASGLGDASVSLISSTASSCVGAQAIVTVYSGGTGYVASCTWRVPSNTTPGDYKLKVAVRDALITWGCAAIPVRVQ